jgi:hypothetical protein
VTRSSDRLPCSAESTDREESLAATASRVRKWMLVEQPGAWGYDALVDSKLDADVAAELHARAHRASVRVVLVRRPGWASSTERRVFLVRSDRAHRWVETLDIDDPRELLAVDPTVLDSDAPPGVGAPGPAAVYLVCANGRRDRCCADRGRPVLRALQEAGVEGVWESSHVGGDRFAANVVCLPTGVYYGRVPPDDAARILPDHAAGLLELDCYRGRCCYPALMQAAEIFVRRDLGERRLDALHFLSVSEEGNGTATVELVHDTADRIRVRVERYRGEPELLTCGADTPSRPWRYRVTAAQVV